MDGLERRLLGGPSSGFLSGLFQFLFILRFCWRMIGAVGRWKARLAKVDCIWKVMRCISWMKCLLLFLCSVNDGYFG